MQQRLHRLQKVRPDTNYRGCMPAIEKRCKNFEWQGHYEMKCHNYRRGNYMKPITQKKNEWTRKKQLESNINGRNSDDKIWKSKQKYSTQAKSRTPEVRPWTQKQDRLQQGNLKKKPTAIHQKSGATLTNLCEFRPATTGKGQKPPEKRPASAKENV